MIGHAVQEGYLTWPKLGLLLVTISLRFVQFWTYKCSTDASLGIDKIKKLVKLMNQVKMIQLVRMSLRSVSGSLRELKSALGYPEQGSALDCQDIYSGQHPARLRGFS